LLALWGASVAHAAPVVTGPEGFLGTWSVVPERGADLDCEGCRTVAHGSARIDVSDLGDGEVLLALELRSDRPRTLHLFLGFSGSARVHLDDDELLSATRGRERPDDVHLALSVRGTHRLTLTLRPPPEDQRWRFRARFLSDHFEPGFGQVEAHVGGPVAAELVQRGVSVVERHQPQAEGAVTDLRVVFPGGTYARSVAVGLDARLHPLRPRDGRMPRFRTQLAIPARGVLRERLTVDGTHHRIGRGVALDRPLLDAAITLDEALRAAPEGARAPIQWRLEEALRAVREGDPDRTWRDWLRGEGRRIAREVSRGRDPFRLRGYLRMAHRSGLDDTAQPYELFVPPGYRGRRDWPLVVTLHGYKGNAGDYFRNTFGLARDYDAGESLEGHGRHGEAPTSGSMIVIAPQGRGKTYYRHAGEVDVLEAIADVRRRLRVDPQRIHVTGGSMGGTGAAYLPFRHPDTFASAAALAGYHDQRVRQDTHHEGLSAAERFLQAHRSDIDWTENALHLPMLLVRGTRDRPLAWTRRQVTRLRELDYDHEHREPELGHNVWTETYAEGAIFTWFARHRRPRAPRHVRLRTARERTLESYWVRIDGRSAPDAFAEVDARLEGDTITAHVEGAAGVTFSPETDAELRVVVDGQRFVGTAPLSLRRDGASWQLGRLDTAGRKTAGVSGPIRDVFHERLMFVIGTRDPAHTFMNQRVARHWAHPHGWAVDYPIVRDVDVTPHLASTHTLVLLGPPSSNTVLARYADRLPITFERDAIVVGERRHTGDETGVAFVAPNPEHPERAILVLAGLTPLGTWRSLFLPDVLPDWVVYDEQIENARGQWSCGGARRDDGSENGADPVPCRYRDHGFFDMRWRLRP